MPRSRDLPSPWRAVSRCHSRDHSIFHTRAVCPPIRLESLCIRRMSSYPCTQHKPPRIVQPYSPPPSASSTWAPTSSKSRSLSALKGRFMPRSSITGSSRPSTLITKLPLPGFSALMTTFAFDPCAERYLTEYVGWGIRYSGVSQ